VGGLLCGDVEKELVRLSLWDHISGRETRRERTAFAGNSDSQMSSGWKRFAGVQDIRFQGRLTDVSLYGCGISRRTSTGTAFASVELVDLQSDDN
jgi:hypothetical protein